ncbi:MAG: hypothetical protein HN341_16105 [Verrucomicrobia bacterium]|jgi:hypothetical protein|nr:hypothetical protein [Verrucomicrobiota bacterium]
MMTCKQVHKALAKGDYRDLPRLQRWGLLMHVSMCFVCRAYNREIMLFQDAARAFREHEEELGSQTRLSEEARERFRAAIRTAQK